MDTRTDVLTVQDLLALAKIVDAAISTAKVARLRDDGVVVYGIARCVGDANGCAMHGEDVRAMHLRVTTREGWEVFWPVADLIAEAHSGEFAQYDW